jgi:ribonucleoside-diphosphate reductase alpha chain
MIALFDYDDEDMLTCKSGKWYETNPQRGRANNSVKILRNGAVSKNMFLDLWKKVELSNAGEPGFLFTNDLELGTNPCAEISLNSFQFCNLVEINASDIVDQFDFEQRVESAAFIGTLQASYTDFHYLRPEWKEVTEREALLGVSMTGIASGVVLNLDLSEAAEAAVRTNKFVANTIGINESARVTTIKPSGTASIVLGCSSGVHPWHSEYYIRRMRVGKSEALYTYLYINHSDLLEDSVSDSREAYVSVPIAAPKGALTRGSESAIEFLERVKLLHEKWIKPGHIYGENTHNVSATVTMKQNEWGMVGEWLWENQNHYNGLSFMPEDLGSYQQTPFEEIDEAKYLEFSKSLKGINVANIVETNDNTNLAGEAACAGGSGCEIS